MSAYKMWYCKDHGEWEDDVDNPIDGCPECIKMGRFDTREHLEDLYSDALYKIAILEEEIRNLENGPLT